MYLTYAIHNILKNKALKQKKRNNPHSSTKFFRQFSWQNISKSMFLLVGLLVDYNF